MAEVKSVLIEDPRRLNGVQVHRDDEDVWRHTLRVIVKGRSKQAFRKWLCRRPEAWRDGVEVVALDGFTGLKTAAAEEIPAAVAVKDLFHAVRLAGDALDKCRGAGFCVGG